MEFDWENVTFDFDAEANQFTDFELDEQNFSNHLHQNFQQPQQKIQDQPVKRSRKEMEEDVFIGEVDELDVESFLNVQQPEDKQNKKSKIEEVTYQAPLSSEKHWYDDIFEYNTDDLIEEEIFEDDEDVKIPSKLKYTQKRLQVPQQSLQVPQQSLQVPQQNLQVPQQNLQVPQQNLQVPQQNLQVNEPNFIELIEEEYLEADDNGNILQQSLQVPQPNFIQEEIIEDDVKIPQQNLDVQQNFIQFIEEEYLEDDENEKISQQTIQVPQSSFIQVVEEEYLEDDENVKIPQHNFQIHHQNIQIPQPNSQTMLKSESGDAIYVCTSCTLDFPSIAYLKRHQNTKKHQRALKMEQRGRKVNQKRKYVRKNEVKPANFQVMQEVRTITDHFQAKPEVRTITDHFQVNKEVTTRTENSVNQDLNTITDLTPEEIELLHLIDDQMMKNETDKSAKNFYENFKFDIDTENEEPTTKVPKFSTVEEIIEPFLKGQSSSSKNILLPRTITEEAKNFVNLPVLVQSNRQPLVIVPQNIERHVQVPQSRQPLVQVPQSRQPLVQVPQSRQPLVQVPQSRQPLVQVPQSRQHFVQVPQNVQPLSQVQHNRQLVQVPQNRQFVQVQQQQVVQVQAQRVPVNINEEQPKSKIQCQMCPKTFNLRCHYTQHMNIVHTGNRNFKCQKCGKKYPQQEQLDIHMEKHTGNKPFKCSKCEKSYNNKVDLKRHEKTHLEVKDHTCKICGGGFVRYDHLEKHMAIHLKNKGLRLSDKIRSRKGLPIKNEVC